MIENGGYDKNEIMWLVGEINEVKEMIDKDMELYSGDISLKVRDMVKKWRELGGDIDIIIDMFGWKYCRELIKEYMYW